MMRTAREHRWRWWIAVIGLCVGVALSVFPDDGGDPLDLSPAAAKTEQAMDKKLPALVFDGASLRWVLHEMRRLTGVRFEIDRHALEKIHVDLDQDTVTARL